MDLIKRQDAIDTVIGFMPKMTTPDGSGWFDVEIFKEQEMFAYICHEIRELPSAQDWILCSKELPKENGRYLVTDFKGDVVTYVFNKEGNSEEYWKRCAKAWMHYPKPYEDEENNVGHK